MRKAVVIGHTEGIGKSIYEALIARGFEVKGLSRSNGYDLKTDMDKIVEATVDADLCINNAYCDMQNVTLLYRLYERWSTQEKMIVNLGSQAGDGNVGFVSFYSTCKAALDKASEQLQKLGGPCRILLLRPGYVDTPRTRKYTGPMMTSEDVTKTLLWCLDLPPHMYICSMSFRHTDQTW